MKAECLHLIRRRRCVIYRHIFSYYKLFCIFLKKCLTNQNACDSIILVPSEVGADGCEGPPVPIPNTAVKLTRVENTWMVTSR